MANLRSIPHNAFPYMPLPKMASLVAFDCLTQLGFDQNAIVENYKFSSTQNDYITLNALVFAHPSQRDLDGYERKKRGLGLVGGRGQGFLKGNLRSIDMYSNSLFQVPKRNAILKNNDFLLRA